MPTESDPTLKAGWEDSEYGTFFTVDSGQIQGVDVQTNPKSTETLARMTRIPIGESFSQTTVADVPRCLQQTLGMPALKTNPLGNPACFLD